MTYRISGLRAEPFSHLFGAYDEKHFLTPEDIFEGEGAEKMTGCVLPIR
ncbi:hypothetical protein [Pantoea conspicua]|nr:hypothetical protein [Pantoea conspicua]